MVKAWRLKLHDDPEGEYANGQNELPNMDEGGETIDLDEVIRLTGIGYYHADPDSEEGKNELARICSRHGYIKSDIVEMFPGNGIWNQKKKIFYTEHLHHDEEVRWVLEGSGYFDFRRYDTDQWIRVFIEKGDMMIVPPGVYHRFTPDTKHHIRSMRISVEDPAWLVPYKRGDDTETMQHRHDYLERMKRVNYNHDKLCETINANNNAQPNNHSTATKV